METSAAQIVPACARSSVLREVVYIGKEDFSKQGSASAVADVVPDVSAKTVFEQGDYMNRVAAEA